MTSKPHIERFWWDEEGMVAADSGPYVKWRDVESLQEQLEAAESILRLADSPVVHAETWAEGVHVRARAYWRGSNPASSPYTEAATGDGPLRKVLRGSNQESRP